MKQTHLMVFSSVVIAALSGAAALPATVSDDKEIKLPQPRYNSDTSIEKAFRERRSIREFKNIPADVSELSQLLWSAQGVTGSGGRRAAPSAGALYPLEIYIVAGNVRDLADGIYLYKPEGHRLLRIADGDRRPELSQAAYGQAAVKEAAAVLVIAAVFERTTVKYGERGNRYVHMEAGHAAQNVYLQAVSLNLGTVVIGAFNDEGVKKAANLSIREQPLYIMPIGKQ